MLLHRKAIRELTRALIDRRLSRSALPLLILLVGLSAAANSSEIGEAISTGDAVQSLLKKFGLTDKQAEVVGGSFSTGGTMYVVIRKREASIAKEQDLLREYRTIGFNQIQLSHLKEGDVVVFFDDDLEEIRDIDRLWLRPGNVEMLHLRYTDESGQRWRFLGEARLRDDSRSRTLEVRFRPTGNSPGSSASEPQTPIEEKTRALAPDVVDEDPDQLSSRGNRNTAATSAEGPFTNEESLTSPTTESTRFRARVNPLDPAAADAPGKLEFRWPERSAMMTKLAARRTFFRSATKVAPLIGALPMFWELGSGLWALWSAHHIDLEDLGPKQVQIADPRYERSTVYTDVLVNKPSWASASYVVNSNLSLSDTER
jgi:hypothetical protein